jgi:hypothetical protein
VPQPPRGATLWHVHPTVSRVVTELQSRGWDGEVRELSDSARTAEAASALRCEVGAIASSLLFAADGAPFTELVRLTGGTPAPVGP